MSDESGKAESAAARREAAATRRRWLTLAEIVAIVGVIIAGLTLWNNWQGRVAAQNERQASDARDAATARSNAIVTLHAKPQDDGRKLALTDPEHTIQTVTVAFPQSLGVTTKTSSVDPTISADWFEDALLQAVKDQDADQQGTLPVLVTSDYWDGEQHVSDTAIYDIVWSTHGRLLRGRSLRLQGLTLDRRSGVNRAMIDRAWSRELTRLSKAG